MSSYTQKTRNIHYVSAAPQNLPPTLRSWGRPATVGERIVKKILALSVWTLVTGLAGLGFAQENYSTAWSGHKNVIVNTSPVQGGASVAGNVLNFPVLVRLGAADSNIFKQSLAAGADLRFTKANNTTRLSHQVEAWNGAGRSAAIWVLMDTVYGNHNAQYIRLHWGNASAADSSRGAQVFRTAQGFASVWHMNAATANADELDATANNLTAVQVASPTAVPGQIGGAREANGSSSYFTVPNSATTLNFPTFGNYTVSAWVNSPLNVNGTVLSKHDQSYALKLNGSGGEWEFFEFEGGVGWKAVTTPATPSVWQHIVGVQNGANAAIYLDGQLIDTDIYVECNNCPGDRNEAVDLALGAEPTGTGFRRYFPGVLDEVRLASVTRNADWAKLEYESQKTGQSMVKLLDTVPVSIAAKVPMASADFSVKASGNGLLFRMDAKGASSARITLVDMWGRTVWSRTADLHASAMITWDGRTVAGGIASQGVYAARVMLLDAYGKVMRTTDRKVPLTR
jgi:hypothetical protein